MLGAGLTYAEAMQGASSPPLLPALAEASRTVGSPQIRNRGTIGGNLGTASPAGDALPPLLVEGAEVELASVRGERTHSAREFLVGVKRNALAPDELDRRPSASTPSGAPQTFMKVGPRNAMVIAVCSLALRVDRERGELRAAFGSAAPTVRARHGCRSTRPRRFPERSSRRASPIDDVRGTAAYRRHALGVLAGAGARAGASREDRADGQRRAARDGRLGRREPPLRAARAARAARARRTRASRASAARARCCSTAMLVCACLVLAAQADGHEVTTVEGLADGDRLHPVQEAFVEAGAVQCGFCTPGLVVATVDLLERIPSPSDDEIREALSGNLCRCTGYEKIFDAVRAAAAA